jgi:tetratricopeptide (TPR) repeat protein
MKLASSSLFFSGIPVRDLLQKINYVPSNSDLQIAFGMIWETNDSALDARKQSHLTNSTTVDHQIRFALKDRVSRSLQRLAADVTSKLNSSALVNICLGKEDVISIEFFKYIPSFKIQLIDVTEENSELLTLNEKNVLEALKNPTQNEIVLRKAQERIYAGDYTTAYKLLAFSPQETRSEEMHYMLGLCTNFFGRTIESEEHFSHLLKSKKDLNVVKASYVISMLYLRMHPKERQSLQTAEDLLENAYQVLENNPAVEDRTFHQVFNRNGFALCLYRRGKVHEALAMLEQGIVKLQNSGEGATPLHQSVLIYNSVQCLRDLKRYSECVTKCQQLLAMDPLFPEYWLELARVLLEQEKYFEAITVLERTEYLDPLIPETQALLGYAYMELNDLWKASQYYYRARQLNPDDPQWSLDLAYCYSELSQWEELVEVLSQIDPDRLSSTQKNNFLALAQEKDSYLLKEVCI